MSVAPRSTAGSPPPADALAVEALRPPDDAFQGPVFLAPNAATPRDAVVSVGLMVFLGSAYLWGLAELCRQSVAFEAALLLGLPALVVATGQLRFQHRRLFQIFCIEAVFNLLAVLSKLAIRYEQEALNTLLGAGFALWFAVQVGGFLVQHHRRGNRVGLVVSGLLAVTIGAWFATAPQLGSVLDAHGRLWIWGAEAPLAVRVQYGLWFVVLLFTATRTPPLFRMQALQLASLGVSYASGAFFHVRLLTACHLFLLDLLVALSSWPVVLGERFAVLPQRWHERLEAGAKMPILAVVVAGMAAVGLASLTLGLDLR